MERRVREEEERERKQEREILEQELIWWQVFAKRKISELTAHGTAGTNQLCISSR